MMALSLAALLLGQSPVPPASEQAISLQVDLDAEVAFVTTSGDYAHERGESGGGMATAWAAAHTWRAGIATRVLNIANDPFAGTNPFAADFIALVGYRFWFSRLAVGPQLAAGVELFGGPHSAAGPALEAGVEAALQLDDRWAIRFRFAFTATPTLEVSGYWRWTLGVEWSSPL